MTEQDKQALIEYYCNRDCGHTREECCLDNCHEIMLIEEFPTTPTDADTISRQAAIDGKISVQRTNGVEIYSDDVVPVKYLENLPSAQPEIIYCKDCKWWDKYNDNMGYCMAARHTAYSTNWEIQIRRTYKGDFYCAHAELEEENMDEVATE